MNMKYIKKFEVAIKYKDPEPYFMREIRNNNIKKVIEFLKQNIIDINNNNGIRKFSGDYDNPLWYAIDKSRYEIAAELIKYGANVNLRVGTACPIILLAAYSQNIDILAKIIDNGANVLVKNEYNRTFFDCLDDNNKLKFIEEYPEQYEYYILKTTTNKFNI